MTKRFPEATPSLHEGNITPKILEVKTPRQDTYEDRTVQYGYRVGADFGKNVNS